MKRLIEIGLITLATIAAPFATLAAIAAVFV